MSNDFHRAHVLPHFWRLHEALAPACLRCGYGGSMRRRDLRIHDLEMVCLPIYDPTDPLKPGRSYSRLSDALQLLLDGHVLFWDEVTKRRGDLYKRFVLPALADGDSLGIGVDLFLADMENYGYILMLRTGCAEFSHAMVTPREKGGLRPSHLRCKDGCVWRQALTPSGAPKAEKIPVATEERLFAEWDLPYVPAADRSAETVQEMRRALRLPFIPALRMTGPTLNCADVRERMEATA